MDSIELIGWLGGFLLATCGLPQVVKTIRSKTFDGFSILFVVWWFVGEILTLTFVLAEASKQNFEAFDVGPLVFNYGVNLVVCTVLILLWWKWRKKTG